MATADGVEERQRKTREDVGRRGTTWEDVGGRGTMMRPKDDRHVNKCKLRRDIC